MRHPACAQAHSVTREPSFRYTLNGFVACLGDVTVARLREWLEIVIIEEDRAVAQGLNQIIHAGFKRMGVEQYPPATINGLEERADVDDWR